MAEPSLSNILSHVLSRHVTINFHTQGVPDPLYGAWYHGWQPFDEDEALHGPVTDRDRPPETFVRDVETRIQDLFNSHSERPAFQTWVCNYRIIVVGNVLRTNLTANFGSVSRSWLAAVIQVIAGWETIMLSHLITVSTTCRIRFRVLHDDQEHYEGHFHVRTHVGLRRGRMFASHRLRDPREAGVAK